MLVVPAAAVTTERGLYRADMRKELRKWNLFFRPFSGSSVHD